MKSFYSVRHKMRAKIVQGKTEQATRIRIGRLASYVERVAKQKCSIAGGTAGPPQIRAVQYFYKKPLNRWVKASPEGEPPYTQTGFLKNSIGWEWRGALSAIVGPSLYYGKYLEFGTRKMAPRPFMGPALSDVVRIFPQFFKRLF